MKGFVGGQRLKASPGVRGQLLLPGQVSAVYKAINSFFCQRAFKAARPAFQKPKFAFPTHYQKISTALVF